MIRFDNVSVKTDKGYIIEDFSLNVNEFEKVLIYGKSGLGKTTLFRLIMGFVSPCAGNVFYKESLIDKTAVWEIRKSVAYVPQNLDITDKKISSHLKDLMALKINSSFIYDENKILNLMNYFELSPNTLDKSYKKLSGGEKQRIAIITAILLERELFLLDEVTSSLSAELKLKVIDYFSKVANKTVIIISHDSEWLQSTNLKKINMGTL